MITMCMSTEIKSINRESASEQVFKQLKHLIDMQVWKPGQKIPSENELAKQFGVSRMTIRAATQKLKTFGLLEVRAGSGSYVREITLESYISESDHHSSNVIPNALSDAFALRFFLEQAAVELAIKNATEQDIEELRLILNKLTDAAIHAPQNFREHDLAFHRCIYVMANNHLLLTFFKMTEPLLKTQIDKFDSQIDNPSELREGRCTFHTQLYQCIANRDVKGALLQLALYRDACSKCSI